MPDIFDKEKYMLHYENLQLYLWLGLKLKRVHPVLELNQSKWLKPYIELNTQNRTEAKKMITDGKSMYKLTNAVQDKTMKNVRNKIDVRLVSNKKRLFTMSIKTRLYVSKIFDNDLIKIRKNKVMSRLNKQAYVGMSILEVRV